MSLLSVIALSILELLAFGVFGSFVLRWGAGVLLLLSVAAIGAGGGAIMLWLAVPALAAWLVGHWLFYWRNGYYKSRIVEALADRVPGSEHPHVLR